MDKTLRSKLIRLAHARPDLRPHLLPLVASGRIEFYEDVARLKKQMQDQSHRAVEVLADKAKKALSAAGFNVTRTSTDVDRDWTVEVKFDIEPKHEIMSQDDVANLVEETIGFGWFVRRQGNGFRIEYAE